MLLGSFGSSFDNFEALSSRTAEFSKLRRASDTLFVCISLRSLRCFFSFRGSLLLRRGSM